MITIQAFSDWLKEKTKQSNGSFATTTTTERANGYDLR